MVHHLAVYIATKITTAIPSETKNYTIFVYAFEKMICQLLIFLFLVILSVYTGVFVKMMIYICFVVFLRGQTSGFHAKSPLGCIFLSGLTSMTCIYLSGFILNSNKLLLLPIFFTAVVYILCTSPVNHILLDLTPFEITSHKKRTYRILACELFLIFLLYLFPATKAISITASLAIITVALFMVLSKITNQEVK